MMTTPATHYDVYLDDVRLGTVPALAAPYAAWPDYSRAMHLVPARQREMYARAIPTYELRFAKTLHLANAKGKIKHAIRFVPVAQ